MRHLVFLELKWILLLRDVQARTGNNAAFVHRVLVRVPQGHELVVARETGERQRNCPANRFQRGIATPLQVIDESSQLVSPWSAIEASAPDIDRMHLSATNSLNDLVAGLLDAQPATDHSRQLRARLRHRNGA